MKNKIIVNINGEEVGTITLQEAKEKAKEFSPYENWKGNTFYEESHEIAKQIRKPAHYTDFDLEELIAYLQKVHEKFGNMPVLYFGGETGCFSKPALSDIDVVKSYFFVTGDSKNQYMNIQKEKALSLFHK